MPYAVDYSGALKWNYKKVTDFVENERHTACATCCIAPVKCRQVGLLQILDGETLVYITGTMPVLWLCRHPAVALHCHVDEVYQQKLDFCGKSLFVI